MTMQVLTVTVEGYLSEEQLVKLLTPVDSELARFPTEPYGVDAKPAPLSVYGQSKLAGERAVLAHKRRDFHVLRTSWVFGPGGKNFPKAILDRARSGQPVNVVTDQIGRPTYTEDLAAAMLDLARQNMAVPANYAALAAKLDVDDFITYMVINYYAGNSDWAHQNWYASFNRVDPNGKWRYHSWDAENVLKSVNENVLSKNDNGGPTEVFQRLMVSPEFRLRFNDVVQKLMRNGGLLTPTSAAVARAMSVSTTDTRSDRPLRLTLSRASPTR